MPRRNHEGERDGGERGEVKCKKKKKKYRTHLSPTCTVFNSTTLTFGEGGLDERPFSPPFSQINFILQNTCKEILEER